MTCRDCTAARETTGHWPYYDPKCLWCGGRILQRIPKRCGTNAEASQRRRAMLAVWMDLGHSEAALRELAAAGPMAVEPVSK